MKTVVDFRGLLILEFLGALFETSCVEYLSWLVFCITNVCFGLRVFFCLDYILF